MVEHVRLYLEVQHLLIILILLCMELYSWCCNPCTILCCCCNNLYLSHVSITVYLVCAQQANCLLSQQQYILYMHSKLCVSSRQQYILYVHRKLFVLSQQQYKLYMHSKYLSRLDNSILCTCTASWHVILTPYRALPYMPAWLIPSLPCFESLANSCFSEFSSTCHTTDLAGQAGHCVVLSSVYEGILVKLCRGPVTLSSWRRTLSQELVPVLWNVYQRFVSAGNHTTNWPGHLLWLSPARIVTIYLFCMCRRATIYLCCMYRRATIYLLYV